MKISTLLLYHHQFHVKSCLLYQSINEDKPSQDDFLLWLCILLKKFALFDILGILGCSKLQ